MIQANRGVRGFVTDAESGDPLPDVVVAVSDIKKNMTSDERGAYWRLLVPGSYQVTFSKKG